ncbi:MAG: Fic family protein [Alphaproteobacteria bacterium]|nr:Fic family protein [Alphaproteobacteria bacterium]
MSFIPKYTITPKIVNALTSIEVCKHDITYLPITSLVIASLRESARLMSTHHSTAIEGNRLTPSEVKKVIKEGSHFPNKKKDEEEVLNYYKALEYIEKLSLKEPHIIHEYDIKMLHGISFIGHNKPIPYRDGQNVIRSGKLVVYIPPKHDEVPILMTDLVEWINNSIKQHIPIPILAGLAHYQFATIHPYYDGNGRTARLLTTLILHKYGYGLKGIYSLEEYYARDLQSYYNALTIGTDEDYYDGNRSTEDLTSFLEYFIQGMSESFDIICKQARKSKDFGRVDHSQLLRQLKPQQRQILKLFLSTKEITTKDISQFFNFSERQARHLSKKWVEEKFLEISNPAPKTRTYQLCEIYETLVTQNINEQNA